MLNFAKRQVDVNTLLENTNALVGFTPNRPTNNTLLLNEKGQILVTTREVTDSVFYEMFTRLSLSPLEKEDSFAQEKMILIWHFSQLLPYLEQRLTTLRDMPKNNLVEYYGYAMHLHGFYQLCNNLILQLDSFNQLMAERENPQKQFWSKQFLWLQQYLSQDLAKAINTAKLFVGQIAHERRRQLTNDEPELTAHTFGPFIHLVANLRSVPIRYAMGQMMFEGHQYRINAHFESFRSAWKSPTRFPFSGKLCINVSEGQIPFHTSLKVYPSWTYGETPEPKPSIAVDFPTDCAHNVLKALYEEKGEGAIALTPVTLRANFSPLCAHTKSYELLPYFVTLVDIAKSQRFSEITVFAPYNYSAVMYAFGFYIANNDKLSPTVHEQMDVVNTCLEQGKKVALMRHEFNRFTAGENPDPILRPFCLDMSDIESRPVYLTKFKRKTTYSALLAESQIIDRHVYPKGVFPEVLQIPLSMSGSIPSFLKQRELTGRATIPAVNVAIKKVDYLALGKNNALADYAYADPEAAQQSGHKKMLTSNRNK